jgi:hypothetical protein
MQPPAQELLFAHDPTDWTTVGRARRRRERRWRGREGGIFGGDREKRRVGVP